MAVWQSSACLIEVCDGKPNPTYSDVIITLLILGAFVAHIWDRPTLLDKFKHGYFQSDVIYILEYVNKG
jgi:hypothetical protein